MGRIAIQDELSAFIATRIANFPTEAPEELRGESPYVNEFAALPLYIGWTETIGIRSDGEIVSWSTEGDYPGTRPVEDWTWVLIALVAGVERYLELRSLLPHRPADAIDCCCRDNLLFAPGKFRCSKCGGLGWLTPNLLPTSAGENG